MAEHYVFFDSADPNNPDRTYNADQFTGYFKTLVNTGIIKAVADGLSVSTTGNNMITTIATGIAFMEGKYYENDASLDLTHDTESLSGDRIDRIVIRLDSSTENRYVKAFIKKGVAGTTPVPPALQQESLIYEISLAQVRIIGGQTYINVDDITDERGTDVICPWAGSNILPSYDDNALADLQNSIGEINGIAPINGDGKVIDADGNLVGEVSSVNGQKGAVVIPDGTTLVKGLLQLSTSLTSSDTTRASTPSAVKAVNDKLAHIDVNSSVGLGADAISTGERSIAIGNGADASANSSVAIGPFITANAEFDAKLGSTINDTGAPWNWIIPGNLAVGGTKNFEIAHPHPYKKATHVLRHGAVESPTEGDTLYRYTVEAITDGETVELQLPDYFQYLNKNVDVYVNGHKHFGNAFGEIVEDTLKVTCEKVGSYKVLVIGTRNDDNVQDWAIKGYERLIGETWRGETYSYEVDEITESQEITEVS